MEGTALHKRRRSAEEWEGPCRSPGLILDGAGRHPLLSEKCSGRSVLEAVVL